MASVRRPMLRPFPGGELQLVHVALVHLVPVQRRSSAQTVDGGEVGGGGGGTQEFFLLLPRG